MTTAEQIEIPLSKNKMILALLSSIVFVAIGFWFLINQPKGNHWLLGNQTLSYIIGLASILFFGIGAIAIIRTISDKKPGLTINRQGIIDNSSGVSAGPIPWSDIHEIKITQVMGQKFLMIIVGNPEDYLEKVRNPLKRNAMKINHKSYGSPISISSNALQTNFDELHKLLNAKMKEFNS